MLQMPNYYLSGGHALDPAHQLGIVQVAGILPVIPPPATDAPNTSVHAVRSAIPVGVNFNSDRPINAPVHFQGIVADPLGLGPISAGMAAGTFNVSLPVSNTRYRLG